MISKNPIMEKSYPLFPFKIENHDEPDDNHNRPYDGVTQGQFKLRHIFEIHAVNTGEEGQGYEDGGNDGQDLHHLVHFVAHTGEIDIERAGDGVPECLDSVNNLDGMVVDIPNGYRNESIGNQFLRIGKSGYPFHWPN